jgi:WD40 repeat protein
VVALFEVSTGRRLLHDPGSPLGAIVSAAWSPSGDRLVIGHEDGYVRVRDAATGDLIWYKLLAPVVSTSGWNASPAFVSFSPDGKLVIVAGRRDDPVKWEDGILAVYEASSGRTVREVYQNEVRWAALAPDGRTAVVATSHGNHDDVHFIGIEVETGRMRWINPPREQRAGFVSLTGMRFRPDSSSFEAAVRGGDVIRLDALTGREQHRFLAEWRTPEQQKAQKPSDPDMWEAEFSADGRTLVSSWKEWIYVWDVESGAMRRKFRHPHPAGCRIALAPDGRTLATSDLNDVFDPGGDIIRLFDIEAGRQILALDPPDGRAHVMAFSPDGKRLFTGSGRGVGVVWDVLQGREAPDAKE